LAVAPPVRRACNRAVQWAADKFRAAGMDAVSLESYTVPALWLGGSAEGSCLAPEQFAVRLVAAPFSGSTPGGAIEASLVDAGDGSSEAFAGSAQPHGARSPW